jgi:hypothetical protein
VHRDTGDSRRFAIGMLCLSLILASAESIAARQTQPQPSNAQSPQVFAPAQPAPAAPRAPVFNRVNEVMPAWLRVRGEFRERVEGFDGAGFIADRQDLYYLTRVRLNATVTPSRLLSFQMQAQDARVAKKTVGATGTPFKAPLDLRLAFADVGDVKTPVAVRVGRQELAFGEQRLIGHVGWLNAARSFDGVKATVRTPTFSVDAFGVSVVRIIDGAFDKSGNGNRFAGAYGSTTKLIPLGTVEPFVLWRRDVRLGVETGGFGDLHQTTVGARLAGRMPGRLDYGVEMAVQRGSLATDDVEAWAGHWQLRESLPGAGAVRLIGEYNYASGDRNSADGVRGTFDQLYPTPHDKYGLADQIGWRNIHHLRSGVELMPLKGLPATANYHSWWLVERTDALYAASGAPIARVIGGATSRHVGHELDVQVTRALTPQLQLAAGYAHIFTGDFLKQATPGASYSHPYVMATYVFLAER